MKQVTWTIGTDKPVGNFIEDGILHHNPPFSVQLGQSGGTDFEKTVSYDFCPDKDSAGAYSNTLGYLDFTLAGGLSNGTQITCTWLK